MGAEGSPRLKGLDWLIGLRNWVVRLPMPAGVRRRLRRVYWRTLHWLVWVQSRWLTKVQTIPEDEIRHPEALPLVSVIVLNDGGASSRLIPLFQTLVRQTLSDWELLVVEGNTAMGKAEGGGRNRVLDLEVFFRVARNKERVRILTARDVGREGLLDWAIAHARGRYICWVEACVELSPTYLEKALLVLEALPAVGFVYSWGVWRSQSSTEEEVLAFSPGGDMAVVRGERVPPFAVFRKEVWSAVQEKKESAWACGRQQPDTSSWQWYAHLLACAVDTGWSDFCIPEVLYVWHTDEQGFWMGRRGEVGQSENQLDARRMAVLFSSSGGSRFHGVRYARKYVNLTPDRMGRGRSAPSMLMVLPWIVYGGAERVMYQILRASAHDVEWYVGTCEGAPEWNTGTAWFEETGAKVYHLNYYVDGVLWRLSESALTELLLHLMGVHRVGVYWLSGTEQGYRWLPVVKRHVSGVRTVQVLHNVYGRWMRLTKKFDRWCDFHICVGHHIARRLRQMGIVSEKIVVIPNGIDLQRFALVSPEERAHLREEVGLPASARYVIGFVGRCAPEKDPLLFLRVAERLYGLRQDVWFLMVTSRQTEEYRRRFKEALAKSLVRSVFVWVEDVPYAKIRDYYGVMDVLVNTSTIEGVPLVVLEALAMGVPVVAPPVGELVDWAHRLPGVVLVRRRTPQEYVVQIQHVLQEAKNSVRTAREQLVREGYTLAAMERRYASWIREQLL